MKKGVTMDGRTSERKGPSGDEARRRAMIEAARRVLQDKGREAVTLDTVIALSGGSRTTLYDAFGGKDGAGCGGGSRTLPNLQRIAAAVARCAR